MLAIFIDTNTYKGISKHSWTKIEQSFWEVVIYLLKNVEHGVKHDIDSASGVCIEAFLNFTADFMSNLQFK